MIVFNFTGLKDWYWLPVYQHESNHDDLWYTTVRWLNFEVIAYSVAMGTEFITRLNRMKP